MDMTRLSLNLIFCSKVYRFNAFNACERASFINIVRGNILDAMRTLIKHSAEFGAIATERKESKSLVWELKDDDLGDNTKAFAAIADLWTDPGIQATFRAQSQFQLGDSTAYLVSRLAEIAKADYVPSFQDVLRSYVRTTGINGPRRLRFADSQRAEMYYAAGQRNQRKKWSQLYVLLASLRGFHRDLLAVSGMLLLSSSLRRCPSMTSCLTKTAKPIERRSP
jgi:guanine nucleotide-binding protein G(i) subunit alpha